MRLLRQDGCKYPGDTVQFKATFQLVSSATTRFDIGLWFGVDGDPDGTGALNGSCMAGTPNHNADGDGCGDISDGVIPTPTFTLTTVCKGTPEGWLILPYCSSWRQNGANTVCNSPVQAVPATTSKCNCDPGFVIKEIAVPLNGGSGTGVGDPHFETFFHRRYDFNWIGDFGEYRCLAEMSIQIALKNTGTYLVITVFQCSFTVLLSPTVAV